MTPPGFGFGLMLQLSLIAAIGPQNAFVLREGMRNGHVTLAVFLCAASDCLLICGAVLGGGWGFEPPPALLSMLQFGGVILLGHMAIAGAERAVRSSAGLAPRCGEPQSRSGCAAKALAFTWLNPHVYLDTVVLIGGSAALLPPTERLQFMAGACVASIFWFALIGYGGKACAPVLARAVVWRIVEGMIAITLVAAAWSVFTLRLGA